MWRYFLAAGITAVALVAAGNRLDWSRWARSDEPPRPVGPGAASFAWNDTVGASGTLHVRNAMGAIRVTAGSGTMVRARARRTADGASAPVYFQATRRGADVYLCALRAPGDRCGERGANTGRSGTLTDLLGRGRGAARVEWTIELPAGVPVDASTAVGGVTVDSITAPVTAATVNGDIRALAIRGPISATTVNGSVTAVVDSLPADGDVTLETVNGAVTATLPPTLAGSVSLETVSGRVSTDFPLPQPSAEAPRQIQGTVGAGGSTVRLETVNGSVTLRRGG